MSWHVQSDLLARYARGEADGAQACSIEAHLPACAHCRAEVATLVDADLLNRSWEGIEERLDAPRRGPVEAGLMRAGVPEHNARLLGATPSLRLSWLLACALVLAFVVWAGGRHDDAVISFLIVAPLLPLAGVALAYGPAVDPAYEVALAAPMPSFRLLLVRALAVLLATTAMAALAALALPGLHPSAAAWLLPSLGLTLAGLALCTRVDTVMACGSLAVLWLLAVWIGWRVSQEPLAVFGPAGQIVCAFVAAAAAVVLARSADSFERRGGMT